MAYGGQSRLRWRPVASFFTPCCFEPAILEERVGDHGHECMTMQALPRPSLEVIEAEFFLQLLVGLLANPSRLDASCQSVQVSVRRQVGEIGISSLPSFCVPGLCRPLSLVKLKFSCNAEVAPQT